VPGQETGAAGGLPAELAGMLLAVTGEPPPWAAAVTAGSRIEGDLGLDSLEVARWAELLTAAYGEPVALLDFLATLDVDQLIGLTVGDVADYVARCRAGGAR
jgi:hypothetical protein